MSIPLHILAVDDQVEVTAFLKEFLEPAGHRVDCAGNGIEALNAVNTARRSGDAYHLLLVDVHMPLLDGLSLVKELRRAKEYVDVAIITGNYAMMPHLESDAQKSGCLMVMHKPLDTSQLTQLVEFVSMRRARLPNISGGGTAAHVRGGMTSRVAKPDTPFGTAESAVIRRTPSGETNEYMPTSTGRAGQPGAPAPPADLNARRTGQFYPAAPPAEPQAFQRRDDPRYTSRVAPPQALPPQQPWDPRQGQALPPVPAPVAQPRDPRRDSGVRDPRYTSAAVPVDPGYAQPGTNGFTPPQAPLDPRYAQPPMPAAYNAGAAANAPQDIVPRFQQDGRYTSDTFPPPADPRYQQPPLPADPRYQQPPPDPRYQQPVDPRLQAPPDPRYQPPPLPVDPRQAPPTHQARQQDPRRASRVALPAAPPVDPRAAQSGFIVRQPEARRGLPPVPPPVASPVAAPRRPVDLPGPVPMRAQPPPGTAPYSPQTDPQFRGAPDPAQSSRVRRSVIGAVGSPQAAPPEAAPPERARMVACAYCRGSFRAVVKAAPYNLVCVHCGQLNRIDP